jgi:hypothetical protein
MMTMKKNRKTIERDIRRACSDLKDQLIHLLRNKIKEFQNLTWESTPTTYYVGYGAKVLNLYNGAAVEWRRNRNSRGDLPDGYGQIMRLEHDSSAWRRTRDDEAVVDLNEFSPLDVALLAMDACETIRKALKSEAAYLLKASNKLMKVIEEAENLSLKKLLEGVPSEVEVPEAIEGK